MGILDIFRGSSDERIAKRLIAEFRAAGESRQMEFLASEFAIQLFDNDGAPAAMCNLANLKHELGGAKPAEHGAIYRRFAKGLMDADSAAPVSYAEARPNLRIALRDAAYGERSRLVNRQAHLGKEAMPMPARPIAGGLSAYCVLDRELGIDFVTPEQLAAWEVDAEQVMNDAFANSQAMSFTTEVAGALHFIIGPNAYNASCLLCTDGIRDLPVRGAPVAAVATRDSLSITGAEDLAGLELLARVYEAELKDGSRHVCGRPLVLTEAGWREFDPPESLRKRFHAIAVTYDSLFWNDYKELLSSDLEARDEDIFVASLGLFDESSTGTVFSAVVWSRDVDTILPPADRVFFFDPEDESKHFALWADVARVMGQALQTFSDTPHAYRVQGFPSAAQFLEMGAKKA